MFSAVNDLWDDPPGPSLTAMDFQYGILPSLVSIYRYIYIYTFYEKNTIYHYPYIYIYILSICNMYYPLVN